MVTILQRLWASFFAVYDRRDTSDWDTPPTMERPIYGVYHIFCAPGWQELVARQMQHLRESGLLDATRTLFVSMAASRPEDAETLKTMMNTPKLRLIALEQDGGKYEYPALQQIRRLALGEDCYLYYFHTKGISYQSLHTDDRQFRSFQRKMEAWREMLEYFIFDHWQVAVHALQAGYDAYGCYQWPPRAYTMFSGNFWWVSSGHVRRLPDFQDEVIQANRFYSEVWLYEVPPRVFSPFETVADLYYVRIPHSVYASAVPDWTDKWRFILTYNWRKLLKHVFGYSYKKRCQRKFQKLKTLSEQPSVGV